MNDHNHDIYIHIYIHIWIISWPWVARLVTHVLTVPSGLVPGNHCSRRPPVQLSAAGVGFLFDLRRSVKDGGTSEDRNNQVDQQQQNDYSYIHHELSWCWMILSASKLPNLLTTTAACCPGPKSDVYPHSSLSLNHIGNYQARINGYPTKGAPTYFMGFRS